MKLRVKVIGVIKLLVVATAWYHYGPGAAILATVTWMGINKDVFPGLHKFTEKTLYEN